jgi:hypothetical protein
MLDILSLSVRGKAVCLSIRHLLCIVIVLATLMLPGSIFAQDEASFSPKADAFSLKADDLGALGNGVNLMTGDASVPLPLVNINGSNGIGINVSISYSSSNIQNIVGLYNSLSPTGIMGMGWSMPISQIAVNNRQTGAKEDDEYFLQEDGSSLVLINISNSGGVRTYKTKTYHNWIVTYTQSTERWEVIKEDGIKHVYGDNGSGRSTVQQTVRSKNWIGDSYNTSNQSQQASAWMLSEIVNTWGQKILYTYTQVSQRVGSNGNFHTEACYLSSISDAWNNQVVFSYNAKLSTELAEPNTEQAEPDAFIEQYERRYLDNITVKNNGTLYQTISFVYDFVNGYLNKRVLKSVTRTGLNSQAAGWIRFDYYTTSDSRLGYLQKVALQQGGSMSFTYANETDGNAVSLPLAHTAKQVTAPAGYAEPRITIANDYTVVTWREYDGVTHNPAAKALRLFVYSWEGRWVERDMNIGGYAKLLANNDQDYQIVTGTDFFGTLMPSYSFTNYWDLNLYRKDDGRTEEWTSFNAGSFSLNMGTSNTSEVTLYAGNDFFMAASKYGQCYVYVWNGTTWVAKSPFPLSPGAGTWYFTATNNYIIKHRTDTNPDQLTFYYLNEQKEWSSGLTISNAFDSGTSDSFWNGSNAFAFVTSGSNQNVAYNWDETYATFTKVDMGTSFANNSSVYVGQSTIGVRSPDGRTLRAWRYDGYSWIDSGAKTITSSVPTPNGAIGDDVLIWNTQYISPTTTSNYSVFNANAGSWRSPSVQTNNVNYVDANVSLNYFEIGGSFYYRQPAGYSYVGGYTISTDMSPMSDRYYGVNKNKVNYMWNGSTALDGNYPLTSGGLYRVRYNSGSPYKYLVGFSTAIYVPAARESDYLNTTSLEFDKFVYFVNQSTSCAPLKDFPVIKVTVDDGIRQYYTSYSYDASTATYDATSSNAYYGLVTVVPGSSTASSKPYGYTENYFFNTRYPGTAYPFDSDGGTYINDPTYNYNLLTGQQYRTKVFDAAGTLVSDTQVFWKTVASNVTNSSGNVIGKTFFSTPYKVQKIEDGVTSVRLNTYNSLNQVATQVSYLLDGSLNQVQKVTDVFSYAYEKYPAMTPSLVTANILSPLVQVKRQIGGVTTRSSLTRWKNWTSAILGTVNGPFDTYEWRGTNASDPSSWDATVDISADWQLRGAFTKRETTTGLVLEQTGQSGQISTSIADATKRLTLAQVRNATNTQIGFTSFEDSSQGNLAWSSGTITSGTAKTGSNYMILGSTGITLSGLTAGERYNVSFWVLTSGGSVNISGVTGAQSLGTVSNWTLKEYQVTGVTSINIAPASGSSQVNIDEVRIYPTRSQMESYTYHPVFGKQSHTDVNNVTTYISYDNLGRQLKITDDDKNIVTNFIYNIKN